MRRGTFQYDERDGQVVGGVTLGDFGDPAKATASSCVGLDLVVIDKCVTIRLVRLIDAVSLSYLCV
jgi:hypothetical protein